MTGARSIDSREGKQIRFQVKHALNRGPGIGQPLSVGRPRMPKARSGAADQVPASRNYQACRQLLPVRLQNSATSPELGF
jgi:hypothetical protein